MELFTSMLIGAILSGITELSKKTKISQTNLLLGATILIAFGYTALNWFNPDLLEKSIQFGLASLGVASAMYMFIKKFFKK